MQVGQKLTQRGDDRIVPKCRLLLVKSTNNVPNLVVNIVVGNIIK